jgi:hypothetical protein
VSAIEVSPRRRAARTCPKCGSWLVTFYELWKRSIGFEQDKDGTLYTFHGNKDDGEPYKVEGDCETCRHQWTVRGATQIIDIGPTVDTAGGRP